MYPRPVRLVRCRRSFWAAFPAMTALVCLLSGLPATAQGTDGDRAAAKQAFEQGLNLEKKGDYATALERFQKVGEFKMTPHVRFHIALCEEKLGKLVAALRGFELAEAEALKMGKSAQVVAEKAPERAETLRKRVASVRIEVTGRVLRSRVLLDGEPVLDKDFGTLIPVDPGKHAIEVETDGEISQKREVKLGERGYETINLEIQDKDLPDVEPTSTAATSTQTAPPPPPPPSKVPAFVLGGVGVLSLIGAGAFYGLRVGALGELNELCPAPPDGGERVCTDPSGAGAAALGNAQGFTIAAGVLAGTGVLALGGAATYWFLTQQKPKPNAQETKAESAPRFAVGVGPGTIRIIGKF